ncbi:MAG: YigZ family protein [Crocinitomicaceae bacterium]|nr:YigZ family protein [Crocinitomicaceae bacterium]MBK8925046.1 YigZ family protein [Crocinitomicaceae bacterium]
MTDKNTYRIVKKPTEAEYREKGSKFTAYVFPCEQAQDAKEIIEHLWKKNPGAVHVCFAWRFGKRNFEDRFSDDGEPAGSAGKPIFGQIISFDLTNILIAVVRYYGGTNLGVGGLMQAYKSVAKSALEKSEIQTLEICTYYSVNFQFAQTGEIMHIIQKRNTKIVRQNFTDTGAIIDIACPVQHAELFEKDIQSLPSITFTITGSD